MIENKTRLRVIRRGEKPPDANVVPLRTKEQRARDAHNTMEPELRSGWMRFLKDLNPQEADVVWRILMHETDDAIADALGISVDEVHSVIDQASSK